MIKGGPKIINDGLVLCLDAHDAKSYAGEPTTNNLDSSDRANANTGPNVSNNFDSIAITKEVVNYSIDRPHVYRFRSTNATGYVSIGYNSSIQNQSGSVYSFSFDYKVVRADSGTTTNLHTAGMTVYGSGYKSPTSSTIASNVTSSEVELSDGWKRVTKTYTCGYTGYNQTRQNLMTQDVGDFEVLIDNIQFEDKTYSTPFADLSRSATNGWVDRTTNNNDGTLTNMVGTDASHYRDGQVIMPVANSYLDFDGTNDYISVADDTTLDITGDMTISCWVLLNSSQNALLCLLVNKRDNSDTTSPYYMFFEDRNGENKFAALIGGGGSNYNVVGSNNNFDGVYGKWDHVCCTVSGTTISLYVNGTLDTTGTVTGTRQTNNVPLRLGGSYTNGSVNYMMSGKMANVLIYNKALTAAEVLSNYNATKERF